MNGPTRAGAAVLLLIGAACGEPSAAPGGPGDPPAVPVGISGGVVIEPPEIRIGDTARLDVVVVTPPGHHVEPIEAPDAPAGFWILDAETPTVARDPQRWIHTTRFRLRRARPEATAGPSARRASGPRTEARPCSPSRPDHSR